MLVERAQINLTNLPAGRTREGQPPIAGCNSGAYPQVKPQLAAFCTRPFHMATIRLASRASASVMASRARFSSMSRRRWFVPTIQSSAAVGIGQVVSANVVFWAYLCRLRYANENPLAQAGSA
jgi:hypothetical protein